MIKQYGAEKGEQVYYAWLKKHGYDDTKPMPKKESSPVPWRGSISIEGKKVVGQALHPIKTYHPNEWPQVRVYLEEELKKSAGTLTGKPFGIDHLYLLPEPNRITRAWWENDAINFEGEVDDQIAQMISKNEIKGVSVEYDWDVLQKANGVAPRGIEFTSLHFLKNFEPGDPDAYVKVLEGVIKKLKERTAPGPQDFILYPIRDLSAFMPEHFQANWVDQNLGIQALYSRLIESPASIQPFALLFMKASGWTPQKIDAWLADHPQYSRASLAPQPVGVQPAPPKVTVTIQTEGVEKNLGEKASEKQETEKPLQESEWDTKYINDLPDFAFAVISKGGEKDEEGKTVPRTLRHLPHHKADGSLDLPHLRNALARLPQTHLTDEEKAEAKRHLCAHAKETDIISEVCGEKEAGKPSTPPTLPNALINPQGPLGNDVISRKEVVKMLEAIIPPPQIVFSHGQTGGFKRLVENILKVKREIEKEAQR
jgi:RNAse (barnase) inhibitor barstar